MAGTRKGGGSLGPAQLCHFVDLLAFPDRTAGSLGINDAGDPNTVSLLGDTPGPAGLNDCGAPRRYVLPGLNTFHDWAEEARFHISPGSQIGALYPAGSKEEVLNKASEFLIQSESVEEHPYVPCKDGKPIGKSGVTIGVGYDLGQHDEQKIRQDWAELDTRTQPPSATNSQATLGLPKLTVDESLLVGLPKMQIPKLTLDPIWTSPLDRVARAARLQTGKALDYLPEVRNITIFKDLALKVFRQVMLPEYYLTSVKFFPGLTELPTGVQVAILSLVFNTGTVHQKEGKVFLDSGRKCEPAPSMPPSLSFGLNLHFGLGADQPSPHRRHSEFSFGLGSMRLGDASVSATTETKQQAEACSTTEQEDFFGNDWEKKELRAAVLTKDLVWIYWYFESMRRIWAKEPGLVKRRNDEADLILPYVYGDLQREAFSRRYHRL